jgi:arsenate reductase
MAEGLLNAYFGDDYEVYSAGAEPSEVNPYAVRVMEEIGIDISNHKSKDLDRFLEKKFDVVVTVCDYAKGSCPFFPGSKIIHKGFKDPSGVTESEEESLARFRESRDEIGKWIKKFFRKKV